MRYIEAVEILRKSFDPQARKLLELCVALGMDRAMPLPAPPPVSVTVLPYDLDAVREEREGSVRSA